MDTPRERVITTLASLLASHPSRDYYCVLWSGMELDAREAGHLVLERLLASVRAEIPDDFVQGWSAAG